MAIGNADTFTFNHLITLPDVFTSGRTFLGNQVTASAAFRRTDGRGNIVTSAAAFARAEANGNQVFTRPPIESKLSKNELNRFGFRNTIGRLTGFLPPQIAILDSQQAASFDFSILGKMSLWLDSSDQSSVVLDGSSRVSAWLDKTGNLRHHVQTTPSKRPYYDTKINGLRAIRFIGTDDPSLDYFATSDKMPCLVPPFTIFIVTRQRDIGGAGNGLSGMYGVWQPLGPQPVTGCAYVFLLQASNRFRFEHRGDTTFNQNRIEPITPYVNNRTVVVALRVEDWTTRNIRVNGVQTNGNGVDVSTMTFTLDRVSSVGAYWDQFNDGVGNMTGEMCEVHVFPEYFNNETTEFVENTLAKKWGVNF